MKKILIPLFIFSLLSCTDFDEKARARIQADDLATQIDQYMEYYEEHKEFSGYVLINSPECVIYERGFGHADYSTMRANRRDTVYRIGSITKMMTAAAMVICEEKGWLMLEDKVSQYIPEFNKGDQISIHQLLSHTSGIPDSSVTLWYYSHLNKDYDFNSLLERINRKKLKYEPGTGWNYSNPNYKLAGEIIERVSGQSLESFFQSELFIPLGMNDTGFGPSPDKVVEAVGYTDLSPFPRIPKKTDHRMSWAAGDVYSTPADMAIWFNAMLSDRFSILFGEYGKVWEGAWYGYGAFLYDRMVDAEIYSFIGHSGGVTGFSTMAAVERKTGISIILLGNYRDILDRFREERIEGTLEELVYQR